MKTPVFHSYGKWHLSGVNTWTVNLTHAMEGSGFDSKVLFTGIQRSPQPELDQLGIPYEFLDVPQPRKRKHEWRAIKDFLEAHAPCIYITNFDFHRSCAVGILDPSVRVITVFHSDEECYYDELRRIGQNCDAIVCVSSYLTTKVRQRFPKLAGRVHFIPYGIPITDEPPPPRPMEGPLRLCYCNRLQQYQKRVFDLPIVAAELERLGVAYELDIAGDGPDAEELRSRFKAANLKSPVRFHGRITNAAVMDLYRNSHIFLLTSDFEGLPISLLEAMSVGCVPVVYVIESGIADAVPSNDYGIRIPHGQSPLMAGSIKCFNDDRRMLEERSDNARCRILGNFTLQEMYASYTRVFSEILDGSFSSSVVRTNQILIPNELSLRFRLSKKLFQFLSNERSNRTTNTIVD